MFIAKWQIVSLPTSGLRVLSLPDEGSRLEIADTMLTSEIAAAVECISNDSSGIFTVTSKRFVRQRITMQKIVIIGAGPAGLTAALELQRAGIQDITIIESDSQVGGISRTVNYKGNRIDIGGHRFFSKSDWVMNWWAEILPIAAGSRDKAVNLRYQGQTRSGLPSTGSHTQDDDAVMLVRNRLSRIYYNRQFFDYPLKLNVETLRKLGLVKTITFGLSYVWARLRPIKPEQSLEDFLINRFGKLLYLQFFKEYTEKVWGVPCSEISAEWGAQRIKSLSIMKALLHAAKSALGLGKDTAAQTSLIEHFVYPKFGPGQMWETAAALFQKNGGVLKLNCQVKELEIGATEVTGVRYVDQSGALITLACTHAISTMPIKDLIAASKERWPVNISKTAQDLAYRDFITVGLLYPSKDLPRELLDNWIYIQEPGVQVGRVQVFNNWSPFMVAAKDTIWLGLEFFCHETDALWRMSDEELKALAQKEMLQIGLVSSTQAQDAVVLRVPKAYPGYFGEAYKNFESVRVSLDEITNLFLVGRNGMHRYNNQDHSMLTAKEAAEQIVSGRVNKAKIWNINVGDDYHEEVRK
jgi:protoporphyrinogen oxidase